MLVRIAKREDPDQNAGSVLFVYAFLAYTILEHLQFLLL